MQVDYVPFVDRMISRYEGGYGWNRRDPGGPTKYGITCYDLADFMHQTMDSMARWAPIVQAMSLATADEIYDTKYATACGFDLLNAGTDVVVFDFGVNSGPSRSVRYAQGIVGTTADGIIGPLTIAAINAYDPGRFVDALCDERLRFLQGLSTFDEFGPGWTARVADLRAYAHGLITPALKGPISPYQDKIERIPLAYPKAYEELRAAA